MHSGACMHAEKHTEILENKQQMTGKFMSPQETKFTATNFEGGPASI